MAFRFGLDSVLKHRQRLEDVAQRDYAEAQAAVDEVLNRLELMYERLDEVRAEVSAMQSAVSPDSLNHIAVMETFIYGQKKRIETTRLQARELLRIAEDKQEALIAAAREKKVMVKLREKRLLEFNERIHRLEAKSLDDITMTRLAWRKK